MSSASVAARSSLLRPRLCSSPLLRLAWNFPLMPHLLPLPLLLCSYSPLLNCFAVDLTAVINDLSAEANK